MEFAALREAEDGPKRRLTASQRYVGRALNSRWNYDNLSP